MNRTLTDQQTALHDIDRLRRPLRTPADLEPLLDRIGEARFVLIGEASHGTSEYYRWRAELSRRLIVERGFSFVAVEGDWPDCFAVNCWVKGDANQERSARDVLSRFARWPTWMWANHEVAEFAEWLRVHNGEFGSNVGFYGLDVYSLWESLDRVMEYLSEHDPEAIPDAMQAVRCFDPYGRDPQRYAHATRLSPAHCEDAVIRLLRDIRLRGPEAGGEAEFDALQNAEVLAGAERYYRTMVRADAESWNVRDCHMVDTLDRLMRHYGPASKAIVWEHNTHVGDARATDMASAGMLNVGQVVRQRHADDGVVLVGLGGYEGSVIAASAWGAEMRRMPVPPAPPDTHEGLVHDVTRDPSLFVFPERDTGAWLTGVRGHRVIGVVYRPERDRLGNWVPTQLGRRYDAFLSFDRTEALHPIHTLESPDREYETYPFNM